MFKRMNDKIKEPKTLAAISSASLSFAAVVFLLIAISENGKNNGLLASVIGFIILSNLFNLAYIILIKREKKKEENK